MSESSRRVEVKDPEVTGAPASTEVVIRCLDDVLMVAK
jgi:hypothetical protein